MKTLPSSLRIGVLRGGPSPEYDVSLKSGANVLRQLSNTHTPLDIFVSKDGTWHMHGLARSPDRILKHVDVVYNAMHGAYGEDGTIQQILDSHGVPYTGSDRIASALSMNKWLTKESVKKAGVKTPISILVRGVDEIKEKSQKIFQTFPHPLIVKPVTGGSSLGVYLVQNLLDLRAALETILDSGNYGGAIVEEYIKGREATCGVIESFRNAPIYSLPVVEIIPPAHKTFYDNYSKYSGESREHCPATFNLDQKREIERLAALVHNTLGLSHYSRSDFIISPKRGLYFLEVNSLPDLREESLLAKSLHTVGVNMVDFLHHVIGLAIK
jgi:D-alanine-D-alanine ligase